MNKLETAMPILLKLIEVNKTGFDAEGIAAYAFEILDAMQEQADIRAKQEVEKQSAELRESLNSGLTTYTIPKDGFLYKIDNIHTQEEWLAKAEIDAELYGVGFVRILNKDGFLSAERLDPKLVTLSYSEQEELQPDWGVAPDWAVAWTTDESESLWWSEIPEVHGNIWFIDDAGWKCASAPSFGYTGSWQDSLRKRP